MCGERLADRMSTDVFRDRVGVIVKIEDTIIQSRLWWYGHALRGEINSQICEVMVVQITGSTKEIVGSMCKEGFETIWLEKRGCVGSKEMARTN